MAGSRALRILTAVTLLALASAAGPAIDATAELRPVRSPSPGTRAAVQNLGGLPAAFDSNEGQFDDGVRFVAHAGGVTAGFLDGAAVLNLRGGDRLCLRYGGSAPEGERKSAARASYFLGNDPKRWRADVSSFERLACRGVAPGVDLVWRGTQRALEYDLVVAPGADPAAARIDFDAVDVSVDGTTGDLVVVTASGTEVRHARPRCFQTIDGARRDVAGEFVAEGATVRFRVGAYDRARELVIDPVISICTYLGGTAGDGANAIAIGPAGDLYLAGTTSSTTFPLVNPYQGQIGGGGDVFATRLLADASSIVYSTYVGGSYTSDVPQAVRVDAQGAAYVAGTTSSPDFPAVSAAQTWPGAGSNPGNGFAFKLAAAGNALVYSTYLGGSGQDSVSGAALDANGSLLICGSTKSTDFPTVNARQPVYAGGAFDGFLTKIASSGGAFAFSTYHGGSGSDFLNGCAVDPSGAVYVGGQTTSTDLALANPMQFVPGSAFLAKYNALGTAYVFATYLGGATASAGVLGFDTGGQVYIGGVAASSDLTGAAGPQPAPGATDGFIALLRANGSGFDSVAFLGTGIGAGPSAIDGAGGIVAIGSVRGPLLYPVNAVQPTYGGGDYDGYVIRLAGTPPTVLYATYLGGNGRIESCQSVAVDAQGAAVIVGGSESTNLPVTSALQATNLGQSDAFLLRLSPLTPSPPLDLTAALEGEVAARLDWVDASTDETAFEIQRRINSGAYTTYATVPAGTETYLDPSVFANVAYTYRIRALGAEGPSAFSNEASVTRTGGTSVPPLPLAPDELHALVVTSTEVALDWRDRSNDELGFDVQRADGAGPYESIGSAPQDFPAYADTDVPPGWPVTYRVRALAAQGPSSFANPVTVTTPATLALTTAQGLVTDSAKPGRDRVFWRTRYEVPEGVTLDPRASGLRLQAGPSGAPFVVTIPPDDPAWKVRRRHYRWTTPRRASPHVSVVVDARNGVIAVNASGFDYAAPADTPVRLLVALGEDGGAVSETWAPRRAAGRFAPAR